MPRSPDQPKPAAGLRVWSVLARSVRPLDGAPREMLEEALRAAETPVARRVGTAPAPVSPPLKTHPPAAKPSIAPPPDRGGDRRVRRGKLEIGAKLDLHGYTQDKAEAALRRFLTAAREDGCAVALVVTGKGGRLVSGETAPGVLKRRLPDWLAKPELRPVVSGFAQAHQRHGGAGAFYVFLRRMPLEAE